MKIECDKCSAKYSIADEKVRGKTFKIRCKKCSNVIIVRDKAAAAGAPSGGAAASESANEETVGWHLAIAGETVGPMTEADVRRRFEAGEIDRETAVWQEGFDDWIPLGEVPAFADLKAPAARPSGDDPFASANQEDYSAGAARSAASLSGLAAAAAASPAAAAASSRLTGQRNENSVLFSLDNLQSLAAAKPKPAPGPGARSGPRNLATQAPSSEGSGLIDIRALGAMVGHDTGVGAPGGGGGNLDDAALPSFGGAGLGGLASTPLVPQAVAAPSVAAATAPPGRSNAPLYILLVVLICALIGLTVILLTRDNDPVVAEATPGAEAPSVKAGAADDEEEDEEKKSKKSEGEEETAEDEDGDEASADQEEGDEDEANSGSSKSSSRKTTRRRRRSSGSSAASSSKSDDKKEDDLLDGLPDLKTPPSSSSSSKSSSAPATSSARDVSVDCILNPSSPGCGGGTKKKAAAPAPAKPAVDPNLPEKLSSSALRSGLDKVKGAAKACGGKHGAAPGTKVEVKLSISGSTGRVTSASPTGSHAGTALGSCAAAALKKAEFSKFGSPSMGMIYSVRM